MRRKAGEAAGERVSRANDGLAGGNSSLSRRMLRGMALVCMPYYSPGYLDCSQYCIIFQIDLPGAMCMNQHANSPSGITHSTPVLYMDMI